MNINLISSDEEEFHDDDLTYLQSIESPKPPAANQNSLLAELAKARRSRQIVKQPNPSSSSSSSTSTSASTTKSSSTSSSSTSSKRSRKSTPDPSDIQLISSGEDDDDDDIKIACETCTVLNPVTALRCEVCNTSFNNGTSSSASSSSSSSMSASFNASGQLQAYQQQHRQQQHSRANYNNHGYQNDGFVVDDSDQEEYLPPDPRRNMGEWGGYGGDNHHHTIHPSPQKNKKKSSKKKTKKRKRKNEKEEELSEMQKGKKNNEIKNLKGLYRIDRPFRETTAPQRTNFLVRLFPYLTKASIHKWRVAYEKKLSKSDAPNVWQMCTGILSDLTDAETWLEKSMKASSKLTALKSSSLKTSSLKTSSSKRSSPKKSSFNNKTILSPPKTLKEFDKLKSSSSSSSSSSTNKEQTLMNTYNANDPIRIDLDSDSDSDSDYKDEDTDNNDNNDNNTKQSFSSSSSSSKTSPVTKKAKTNSSHEIGNLFSIVSCAEEHLTMVCEHHVFLSDLKAAAEKAEQISENTKNKSSMIECCICSEPYQGDFVIPCNSESEMHFVCKECFHSYATITNTRPVTSSIKCPVPECGSVFSTLHARENVSKWEALELQMKQDEISVKVALAGKYKSDAGAI